MPLHPPSSSLFPYTTLFRSMRLLRHIIPHYRPYEVMPTRNITFAFNHIGYKTIEDYGNGSYFCFDDLGVEPTGRLDRKSTRLNSSHVKISYAVFCLKKNNVE